ncbi:MAG TPA: hypothetical protein VFA98_09310 [Thermoanaerobaculia bacterium]|jgi:hypothetical protein|nr:hypothetical protein [Thermoanaerobaculia bacterium]
MRRALRRLPSFYLLAIFLAAAVAPHHHLDPIADLFSDRPSNSGTFVQITGPGSLDRGVYPGALVQDESCFACFHSDFVASPAVAIAVIQSLAPLAPHRPLAPPPFAPAIFVSGTSSRAPPAAA